MLDEVTNSNSIMNSVNTNISSNLSFVLPTLARICFLYSNVGHVRIGITSFANDVDAFNLFPTEWNC